MDIRILPGLKFFERTFPCPSLQALDTLSKGEKEEVLCEGRQRCQLNNERVTEAKCQLGCNGACLHLFR